MIKVTENKETQELSITGNADDFAVLTDCIIYRMAAGDHETQGHILSILAIMPPDTAQEAFQHAPLPKHCEPLRGFWKDVIPMMHNPECILGKKSTTVKNKDIVSALLGESELPKPRFNPEQ